MLDTRLDPRQTIIACLSQWRQSTVECDHTGLQDQVRDIEAVSRMLHSVMLQTVAELESRNIAATTGFGTTKRLLAGMLQLSAIEAGMRVAHATHRWRGPVPGLHRGTAARHPRRRHPTRQGIRPHSAQGAHPPLAGLRRASEKRSSSHEAHQTEGS